MTPTPPHWDTELERIEAHARHIALAHKATAMLGVAVDDAQKRDYFVPRLQKLLDENTWAKHLTFRVVPLVGEPIELKAAASASPEGRD